MTLLRCVPINPAADPLRAGEQFTAIVDYA
jgi:hypothetical protein